MAQLTEPHPWLESKSYIVSQSPTRYHYCYRKLHTLTDKLVSSSHLRQHRPTFFHANVILARRHAVQTTHWNLCKTPSVLCSLVLLNMQKSNVTAVWMDHDPFCMQAESSLAVVCVILGLVFLNLSSRHGKQWKKMDTKFKPPFPPRRIRQPGYLTSQIDL